MSFHARLKEATHRLHEETEQQLFPDQPWHALSLDDYRQFLYTQYVFHGSMERALTPTVSAALKERLRWPQRQKQSWIVADLSEITSPVPEEFLEKLFEVVSVQSEAEALGYLYVTEGSMLGGRVICRALQNNAHIALHSSFRFLTGYGAQTGLLWKEFLQVLAQEVRAEDEQAVIEAAKRAFGIFAQSVRFIQSNISTQTSLRN